MPRPTSTHEQREAVRALAVQVGVREAARRLALNESRVQMWSMRYDWFPKSIISPHNDAVTAVTKVADHLAEYGKTTKLHIASATNKASEKFEAMEADKIIEKSGRLLDITKVASTIHGWQDSQASSALNVNVLSGGRAIVQVKTNENQGSHEANETNSIENTDV